ncbi:hypothetical protein RHGRI_004436 [Rhododendron griersonianum]|uniref:Gnk2-homologous domain-containing protein n=1 Tax=Rhododendron griersonianum TaxID=479676 RepID=A0AAV6LBK1_9ERIC|nr:hypothetical protein RHGRI_004436 [Rhododendron griersonianum]
MEDCHSIGGYFSDFKVADLYDPQSHRSRAPLISALFQDDVARNILALYVPREDVPDELFCEAAKDGVFAVKLAYFLQFNDKNDALVRRVCAFEVAVNWFGTLIKSIKPGKVLCPWAGISDSAGGCAPDNGLILCCSVTDGAWDAGSFHGAAVLGSRWMIAETVRVAQGVNKVMALSAGMVETIAKLIVLDWATCNNYGEVCIQTDCAEFVKVIAMGKSSLELLFLLLSCMLGSFRLNTAQIQMCINTANFTNNGAYGENRKEILSSLASNVEDNGGFYTGHIGEGSERVYALGLCRSDLHGEDCFSCVNSSSQAIIEKCPNQKEATNFGPPSLCIVRYSDKNFSRITDSSPAQLIYNLSKITNNTDEFDQALNSLVDSLIDTAANGPPRSMFAILVQKSFQNMTLFMLSWSVSLAKHQMIVGIV